MRGKTPLELKDSLEKRNSLHTCSHEKLIFEFVFEKTAVVRTRVQSALAIDTFTAVLQYFLCRGRFGITWATWGYFW